MRCTSWTRARRRRRHVHVDIGRRRPPRRRRVPVSAMVVSPRRRAASNAATTFGDAPLVVMPSATSPASAERLDLPREHALERRSRWPIAVRTLVSVVSAIAASGPPLALETARRAPRPSAARRRRCRRCRTPARLPPAPSAADHGVGRRDEHRRAARRTALVQAQSPRRTSIDAAIRSSVIGRVSPCRRVEPIGARCWRGTPARSPAAARTSAPASASAPGSPSAADSLPVVRHQQPRGSGWPSNTMPNRSQTSRSSQFADGHTVDTVGTCGVVAGSCTFIRSAQSGRRSTPGGRRPRSAARAARSPPPSPPTSRRRSAAPGDRAGSVRRRRRCSRRHDDRRHAVGGRADSNAPAGRCSASGGMVRDRGQASRT